TADVGKLDSNWPGQLDRLPISARSIGRGSHERRRDASLLQDLPNRGIVRQFVRLDVAAWRQPPIEAFMEMEQYAPGAHHKHGYGEITGLHVAQRPGASSSGLDASEAITTSSAGADACSSRGCSRRAIQEAAAASIQDQRCSLSRVLDSTKPSSQDLAWSLSAPE